MKKMVTAILAIGVLSGCKIAVVYDIDIKDFDKKADQNIYGQLAVQVARCIDKKTGLEDDKIILLKSKVPHIFNGSTYIDCVDKGFNSFARFKLPAYLDNNRNNKSASNDALIFSYFKKDDGERSLYLLMPDNIRDKLNKFIKSSYTINVDDFSISTRLNFHDVKHTGLLIGVYLNDVPYQAGNVTISGQQTIRIPAIGLRTLLQNPTGRKTSAYLLFGSVTTP